MVVDALSRLLMDSVAHIEYNKKGLVRDIRRLVKLGVQLVDFHQNDDMVDNGSQCLLCVM